MHRKMLKFSELPDDFKNAYYISFHLIGLNEFHFFDDHIPFFKKYWFFFVKMFIMFIQLLSMAIYIVTRLKGDLKIPELAYLVSNFIIIFQAFIKSFIILYYKENIQKFVLNLGDMWRTDDNLTDIQIQNKNSFLKTLNVGQVVCYWGSVIVIWVNVMLSLIITLVRWFILHQNAELMLPLGSAYVVFDPSDNWFLYIMTYLFQLYAIVPPAYMYFGLEIMTVTLCAHLSTSFSLLREDLKNITPRNNRVNLSESSQNEPTNVIENVIKQHQKLIQLTALLNDIFSIIFFISLSCATLEISFYAFASIVAPTPMDFAKSIVAVTLLLPMIFVTCYYSELLREESGGIADAAYENLWYQGDIGYQKIICYIILRAQNPCTLMALNYAPITLNTFTKVVNTTWSYLSLAMTLYSKD